MKDIVDLKVKYRARSAHTRLRVGVFRKTPRYHSMEHKPRMSIISACFCENL